MSESGMVLMKKSKCRRELTRARGISSVVYYPYLFSGAAEDSRAVLVVVSVTNLIRITSYKQGGRAMFDKQYN
jgi:hypothetical protein